MVQQKHLFDTLLRFRNLSALIAAEDCCKQIGIIYQIEPLPPSLTSDCGMCIALDRDAVDSVRTALTSAGIVCSIHDKQTSCEDEH